MILFISYVLNLLFLQTSFAVENKFEIKLRVSSDSIIETLDKLNLNKSDALKEKIYLLDSFKKDLKSQGIFLRVKINEEMNEIQTNIKINGLNSSHIDSKFKLAEGFKCETNLTPLKETQSCALAQKKTFEESIEFSDIQLEFLNTFSKDEVKVTELQLSKAFFSYEWELKKFGQLKKVKVELWELSASQNFLEISYKVNSDPKIYLLNGVNQLHSMNIPLDPNPSSRLNFVEF